ALGRGETTVRRGTAGGGRPGVGGDRRPDGGAVRAHRTGRGAECCGPPLRAASGVGGGGSGPDPGAGGPDRAARGDKLAADRRPARTGAHPATGAADPRAAAEAAGRGPNERERPEDSRGGRGPVE